MTPCGAEVRTPFVVLDGSLVGACPGDRIALREDQRHHLTKVLRRQDGDAVEVTDGAGLSADAELTSAGVLLTCSPRSVAAVLPAVTVVHALPKGRAMDDVVRTLVELGVSHVDPVLTARTESRPSGAKALSVAQRLRSVAVNAAQQARSAHLCGISDISALDVTQREGSDHRLRLVAHPGASVGIAAAVAAAPAVEHVSVLIGPEGGLTDQEVEALVEAGWVAVRAGTTVLRTVNAGAVLTAAVMALTGRFDAGS